MNDNLMPVLVVLVSVGVLVQTWTALTLVRIADHVEELAEFVATTRMTLVDQRELWSGALARLERKLETMRRGA